MPPGEGEIPQQCCDNQKLKTISLCMIVKDEQAVIERCLRPASVFADEIIVVDTGSTDATKVIAKRYTDKVYDYIWQDDFATVRNYSYSFATCDYILWLDADDVLEGDSIKAICDLKYLLTDEVDVVTFVYGDDINEQLIQGNDRILRDRLIKRLLGAQRYLAVQIHLEGFLVKLIGGSLQAVMQSQAGAQKSSKNF